MPQLCRYVQAFLRYNYLMTLLLLLVSFYHFHIPVLTVTFFHPSLAFDQCLILLHSLACSLSLYLLLKLAPPFPLLQHLLHILSFQTLPII